MNKIFAITRKELNLYFGSPMALIFIGVFLILTLFVFFWVDSFFARGIADVRALFEWMPILMIFLVSSLTMHQWSSEDESGNLQVLLTMPIRLLQLVIGKFLSVIILVSIALLLTLFLPITVSSLGNLDWGPVIGGYLASLLMASAYIAIGLFISSRTSNQLVALIGTAIVCGLFQAVGSPVVTDLVGSTLGDVLRSFGTSSRFESIERGVVDFRDLIYYLSITFAFLGLNILSLDSKRWSTGSQLQSYRRNTILTVALIAINLLAFNFVIAPASTARLDLTQHQEYSLSDVTTDLMSNLQEPLWIRGYFSETSHPLLAPLVPRIKDTLREYEVASNNMMSLEFVDPITDPEMEREANQVYGIRPTPLQTNNRGGVSLVNVYFDLLIGYGDQTATLNFSDLIEVVDRGTGADIQLRNLEFDLTSSIQRVVFGFQSLDAVLESLTDPAQITLYMSSATLPESMNEASDTIQSVSNEIAEKFPDKVSFNIVEMSAEDAPITEQQLFDQYQIQPVATSFFATETFYLHLVIEAGNKVQVIFPSGELSQVEIRNAIESTLKRSSSGFLKVVGLWIPQPQQTLNQFGQSQQLPNLQQYGILEDTLRETYEVQRVNLSDGRSPDGIDVLIIIAPNNMTNLERFAIDQYIMRGGSVIVAGGHYRMGIDQTQGALLLEPNESGIEDMLEHYGITIEDSLVMDTQNAPFPVQTQRDIGGMLVNELQAMDYPYFVDIRPNTMNADSAIVNRLPFVTMNWSSPITIDESLLEEATVTTLLTSSDNAWTTTSTAINPDFDIYPELGFATSEERQTYDLAVAVQGKFESFFVDQPSPFESEEETAETAVTETVEEEQPDPIGLIEQSPSVTSMIVLGSSEFVNDNVYQISRNFGGDRFASNIQMIANSIDWFTEDISLASIRSRGNITRILPPISDAQQNQWVVLNYAVALISLITIGVVWQLQKRAEQPMPLIAPRTLNTRPADSPKGDD